MDEPTLRSAVFDALHHIAPEIKPGDIEAATPLRDQVDLDSMDWLNLLDALHSKFAIEIPEADYEKLVTLNDLLGYLKRKVG